MNRLEALYIHLSNLLVVGTGLVYAWMLYAVEPRDAYAVVNHPLQPTVQHLHVWVAPALVFAAGLLWRGHVRYHWQMEVRQGRRSGLAMLIALVPMVTSGYLLQTAVSSEWRQIWVVVHLTAGGLWLAAYGGHLLAKLISGERIENGMWNRRPRSASPRPVGVGRVTEVPAGDLREVGEVPSEAIGGRR